MNDKVFGNNPMPPVNSYMRAKHMSHIAQCIKRFTGLKSTRTMGKINATGRLIDKPNWDFGMLTYEPNPDAAVHELAHVFLAPIGMSLAAQDQEMRSQYGFVNAAYGYAKQKRSYFEVMPMAMEQKIRRRCGLPPSLKFIAVKNSDEPHRTSVEDGAHIAIRVKHGAGWRDLLRCAKNLDAGCLKRLEMIDNGEIKYGPNGWYVAQNIDAKINKRARLRR